MTAVSSEIADYCSLLENQKGHTCAHLIEKILSNDSIFVFGDFLNIPSVQALKDDTKFIKTFNTLNLFAYGNFTQYNQDGGSTEYIPLNESQMKKLRILSLVSIAETNKMINYAAISIETGLTETRELEDLLIETIYAGLVSGEIDQRGKVFRVNRCTSRDVSPQALEGIINQYKAWREKCDDVTKQVESSNQTLKSNRISALLEQNQLNIEIQRVKLTQKDTKILGPEDVDRMEDGEDEGDDVGFDQEQFLQSNVQVKSSALRSAKRMKGQSIASTRS